MFSRTNWVREYKRSWWYNATPKFFKHRSVPYAIRGAIEKDLECLGVIEKVSYSDWAAPIVPVPKADGSVRICGDYKVTVNHVLLGLGC